MRVGLGSAGHSTRSTLRRKFMKIEIVAGGQYYYCHAGSLLPLGLVYTFSGSEHVLKQTQDLSGPASTYYCHPLYYL